MFYPLFWLLGCRVGLPLPVSHFAVWTIGALFHGMLIAATANLPAAGLFAGLFVAPGWVATAIVILGEPARVRS